MIQDRVRIAPEVLDPIWSTLLVPRVADVDPMFPGNTSVLWGPWFPVMIWWGIFVAASGLFALGWGVIWRRR